MIYRKFAQNRKGMAIFRRIFQLINNKRCMAALAALLLSLWGCGSGGGGGEMSASSSTVDSPGKSVSLAWQAPQTKADGTPLKNLGGYRVHYSPDTSTGYTYKLDVGNRTEATISGLSPGTWCFAVTAYNTSGVESDYSTPVCTRV